MKHTSLFAYQSLLMDGTISSQEQQILEALYKPMTSRQISKISQLERSSVTGRLNSLVKKKLVEECGDTICKVTKKKVTLYRVVA